MYGVTKLSRFDILSKSLAITKSAYLAVLDKKGCYHISVALILTKNFFSKCFLQLI